MIEQHLAFAESGAHKYERMSNGRFSFEDLRSAAYLGLVKAARSFQPSRGFTFKTYAFQKIDFALRGMHREWRRQHGWSYTANKAEQSAGAVAHQQQQLVSFQQAPVDQDGVPFEIGVVHVDHDAAIHRREQIEYLLAAMTSERDRIILRARLNGESHRAIAKRLGISGARVQQLEVPIMERAKTAAKTFSTRRS